MVKNLTTKADAHDAPTRVIENSEPHFRKGWMLSKNPVFCLSLRSFD
jgi:hypothetical protein